MGTIQEIDFSNVESVVKDGISLTELVVDGVTIWNSAYLGKLWQQIGSDVNGGDNGGELAYRDLAGFSVSISKSGTRVAVSSPSYVVNEPLVERPNRFSDNSTGQNVLGSVTVYDWNGTNWSPMEIADSRHVSFKDNNGLTTGFGLSAELDYQNEQRYNPFRLNPSVAHFWNLQAYRAGQYTYPSSGIVSSYGGSNDNKTHPSLLFGQAMDMSDDGDHLVIASRGSHSAHINPERQRDRECGYLSYWKAEDIDGTKKWALKGLAYDFNYISEANSFVSPFEEPQYHSSNPGVGETVKISRDGSVIAVVNSNGQAWVVKSETGSQSLTLDSGEVSSSEIYHGLHPDLPLATWETGEMKPAHSLSAKTMVKFKLANYSTSVDGSNSSSPYSEAMAEANYNIIDPQSSQHKYIASVVGWEDGDLIPLQKRGSYRGINYFIAYARLSDGTIQAMRFPLNSTSEFTDISYDFEEPYAAPSHHVLSESGVRDIAINGDGRICVVSRNVTRGGLPNSGEVSVYRTAFGEYKNEDGSLRSFDYPTKVGLSINAERYSGFEEDSLFGDRLAMDGSGLTFAGTIYKSGKLYARTYKLGASGSGNPDTDAGRLGVDTYTQVGNDIPLFVAEFGNTQQITSFEMSADGLTISAQIDGYIWPSPYKNSDFSNVYISTYATGVMLPYDTNEPATQSISASTATLVYRWSGSSWGLLGREIKYAKSFDGVSSIEAKSGNVFYNGQSVSQLPVVGDRIRIGPNTTVFPARVDSSAPINTGSILSALNPRNTSDISEDGSVVCSGKPLNDMSGFGSGAHSTFELR